MVHYYLTSCNICYLHPHGIDLDTFVEVRWCVYVGRGVRPGGHTGTAQEWYHVTS